MTELLTAAQMRAIEQAAIDSGAVTGLELMERAGHGVVSTILEWRPELATAPHRAVVLCGPGNNGGDGFVIARLLKWRGWHVEVFLYGDEGRLPPDAAENFRRWRELGEVAPFPDRPADFDDPVRTIVVDALFGTGLTRALAGRVATYATTLANMRLGDRPEVFSVDIASGYCADSGRALGPALPSELCISFHLAKVGHFLTPAAEAHGDLKTADIGLPHRIPHPSQSVAITGRGPLGREAAFATLSKAFFAPAPARHKYDHGHALVLSGGVGKGGAARMAARGCLRIGAGLVTLACPPAAVIENAARLDAIMLRPVADAEALAATLQDSRLNALLIGPGHGGGERTRAMTLAALAARRATVLDADALTAFAEVPDALFAALHPACVLTPHAGEFARLFPDIAEKLAAPASTGPAYSKVDATREAAARAGCTVLYKGADTVIADQSGRAAINSAHYDRAAPWLATAGAGDVLAGFITGLLARGFAPMAAAETAAWLHVEVARSFGAGLIAEDLPEELPKVFRVLGL